MRARRFLPALALLAALALAGCAPPPPPVSDKVQKYYDDKVANPTATAATAAPVTDTVAFIGDSYTSGAGAAKGAGFADLIAAQLKLKASNFSQGGTGYVKRIEAGGGGACGNDVCPNYGEMADQVIAKAPAIVIVSGGRNDPSEPVAFDAATNALFSKLRSGLPNAKIIATSPVWGAEAPPIRTEAMNDSIRAAVTAVGGTFVDVGQPFTNHPELITGDNVHPNDAGHRVLADAVLAGFATARVKIP